MGKSVRSVLFALIALPLTSCVYSNEAIEGKVLEAGTLKPIPGAIVRINWVGEAFAMVESPTICVHQETAVTDAEGRYAIPAWHGFYPNGYVQDVSPWVFAYRPGYVESREYRGNYSIRGKPQTANKYTYLMEPFKGTREERLEYLSRLHYNDCGGKKELAVLYKAAYEEAKSIAVTKEDHETVRSLHYSLDTAELGKAEADKKLFGHVYDQESEASPERISSDNTPIAQPNTIVSPAAGKGMGAKPAEPHTLVAAPVPAEQRAAQ